jgi:hypothetical protein
MLYKSLKTTKLQIESGGVIQWECGTGVVLVPQSACKIFAHWHTDKGNLRSTYTITGATRLEGLVQLTNALDTEVIVQIVDLD